MSPIDPQFLYMALILPGLFGLTLVGEGVSKMMHEGKGGGISIFFGFVFIGIVVFAFVFFSAWL